MLKELDGRQSPVTLGLSRHHPADGSLDAVGGARRAAAGRAMACPAQSMRALAASKCSLRNGRRCASTCSRRCSQRAQACSCACINAAASNPQPVLYHELAHGVTFRSIKYMGGTIAFAFSEGASDVNSFLLLNDDRASPYLRRPYGVRRYRYKGYPLTYK